MKQQLISARALLIVAAFALTALTLAACSHPAPPPTAAPPSDQVQTKNMSPDDAVKAHINQMQQNSGGGK